MLKTNRNCVARTPKDTRAESYLSSDQIVSNHGLYSPSHHLLRNMHPESHRTMQLSGHENPERRDFPSKGFASFGTKSSEACVAFSFSPYTRPWLWHPMTVIRSLRNKIMPRNWVSWLIYMKSCTKRDHASWQAPNCLTGAIWKCWLVPKHDTTGVDVMVFYNNLPCDPSHLVQDFVKQQSYWTDTMQPAAAVFHHCKLLLTEVK